MPATKRAAKIPASAENIPAQAEVETWRNETPGIITINRVGEYGRKVVDVIQGGRTFLVTPQERRMNQNACASGDLDVFTNGSLRPIELVDGDPDAELLRTNPNTFSDEELKRVFALKGKFFAERVAKITNPVALARLAELARDPQYEATLFQYETVKSRELDLKGKADKEPPARDASGLGRPVTPR